MKILGGIAVVNDSIGKRLAYTYSEVDEQGQIVKSNIKESFVILDEETSDLVSKLEAKVKERF